MKISSRKVFGFTLIEIMVIVVIVGILAAIALPMYRNYVIRSVVTEALVFADEERIRIEEFYESSGRMPLSASEAGLNENPNVHLMQQVLWTPGIPGQPSVDKSKIGTMRFTMNLSEYGNEFGEYNSTFLFIGEVKAGAQFFQDTFRASPRLRGSKRQERLAR